MIPRAHAGGDGAENGLLTLAHAHAPDLSGSCDEIAERIVMHGLVDGPGLSAFLAHRLRGWLREQAERIGADALDDLARRLDDLAPTHHRRQEGPR